MSPGIAVDDLERLEIELLLEALYRHHGMDFRGYALGSLRRRLWRRVHSEGLRSISGLQELVLHDPEAMQRMIRDLSISVTAMYRDPTFFRAFRERVVPLLRTYPFIRIWNAGCATGEETWSLAILMQEAGLFDRTRIYATDVSEPALEQARQGSFPLVRMREYTRNYLKSAGPEVFSSYYAVEGDRAVFDRALAENVVFAQHNLVSDGSFNDFHAIVCRNVMIYFGNALQERVLTLLHESLNPLGVLALGQKETVRFTSFEDLYEPLDAAERIFRRVR